MGMDLSWMRARDLVGSGADYEQGWPSAIAADTLPHLQSGFSISARWDRAFQGACARQDQTKRADPSEDERRFQLLQLAISHDVQSGALPSSRVAVTRRVYAYWNGEGSPPEEREVDEFEVRVSAQDFAIWLARQGEEPGEHVQSWFKSQDVQWPPALPADESDKLPKTYQELIRIRGKGGPRQGREWLPEEIKILKSEYSERGRTYSQIAADFGQKEDGKPVLSGKRIGQIVNMDVSEGGKRQRGRQGKNK